ncbi:hypothetical protein [Ruegeria arenilitoris]|uniref:hypothetical protein n=1 Tax=Ruegeria arenilitoris TaxID=1173585 RepID=UPI00147B6C31|nr:hypothetical protein [Ruegeria arenilitoris]
MSKYISVPQFLLCLVIACCAFPLIYVVLATKGNTWVYPSLVVGQRSTLILFCAVLLLVYVDRSKRLFLGVFIATLILVFGSLLSGLECAFGGLSGGYNRFTNCGLDFVIYAGLVALGFAIISSRRSAVYLVCLLVLSFPIGVAFAHFVLTAELKRTLTGMDLQAECVVRQPIRFYFASELSGSRRIQQIEDLDLTWIIGEQSPRIYKFLEGDAYIWKYDQKSFERMRASSHLVAVCEGS